MRDRFNSNALSAPDVEFVLQRAALLDSFVRNNRLANRAARDRTLLRGDLHQIARIYTVA